jgi:hypothetical protein
MTPFPVHNTGEASGIARVPDRKVRNNVRRGVSRAVGDSLPARAIGGRVKPKRGWYLRTWGRLLLRGSAAAVLAGCYSFEPFAPVSPQSGDRVSIDLSKYRSEELSQQVGRDVVSVWGRALDADQLSVRLSVLSTTNAKEHVTRWNGEEVRISLQDVAQVNRRRFSLGRTLLGSGGVFVAAFLAFRSFSNPSQGSPTSTGGGTGLR